MSVDRQSAASNRNVITGEILARAGIDAVMIEAFVRAFYERARHDPLIGPVFESRVHNWEVHMGRRYACWSSVALMTGRYHGQPMVAHLPLPIDSPHFDRWLEIFAETTREMCPPAAAAHFLDRAFRIADSLELGISPQKGQIRPKRARPTRTLSRPQDAKGA